MQYSMVTALKELSIFHDKHFDSIEPVMEEWMLC